jgi:cyclophilin family peptidyl-prolyl cis-trans isomerase
MSKLKKKNFTKKYKFSLIIISIILVLTLILMTQGKTKDYPENSIIMKTSMGDIIIQLNPEKAPITVENFKSYIEKGFYDGLIFHRVIEGFMIQGGGFETTGTQKSTKDPIILESNNGLSNEKYTIAMARTMAPNSATSQFFINTVDNKFLDYAPGNDGYAVFGKVIDGQEIVDKIEKIKTTTKGYMQNWPIEDVLIESIELI